MTLHLFLLVLACVLFFIAGFVPLVPNFPSKVNLIAWGLFCWVLSILLSAK